MTETLDEILERRFGEGRNGGAAVEALGKHPDYDSWPRRAKFPVIDGEQWMLCTDGCYFVSMDKPEMLVVAHSRVAGPPIHPALRRQSRVHPRT